MSLSLRHFAALPKFEQGRLTTALPPGKNSPDHCYDYVLHNM